MKSLKLRQVVERVVVCVPSEIMYSYGCLTDVPTERTKTLGNKVTKL
jgi:hypothetical protein